MRRLASQIAFCLLLEPLGSCGPSSTANDVLNTEQVTLPDGFRVLAEVKRSDREKAQGLMYRDSMPADHGMLFINGRPERAAYWMANCKFALDIIWMDANHRVIEISADTPPCPSGGYDCPSYGGHEAASYVLELNAGEGARHGVRVGAAIPFEL